MITWNSFAGQARGPQDDRLPLPDLPGRALRAHDGERGALRRQLHRLPVPPGLLSHARHPRLVRRRRRARCRRCPAPTIPSTCTAIPAWYPGRQGRSSSPRAAAVRSLRGGPAARARTRTIRTRPRIQYDLYRMPFDEGQGGTPVPIEGASRQRDEQHLPQGLARREVDRLHEVRERSADAAGRQALDRPGSRAARRARCAATRRCMNSWHSFSPNGRWMVFSSKVEHALHADVPHPHRRGRQRHARRS